MSIDKIKSDILHLDNDKGLADDRRGHLLVYVKNPVATVPGSDCRLLLPTANCLSTRFPARHIFEHFGGELVDIDAHSPQLEGGDLLIDLA